MAFARIKNDTVFVDGIDLKRAARRCSELFDELSGSGAPKSQDGWLELVSKLLGFDSHHALLSFARQNDDAVDKQMFLRLEDQARLTGAAFPKDLPARLNSAWCKKSVALFEEALGNLAPSKCQFVALVGSEGCGKTLLARQMVLKLGGSIQDVSISSRVLNTAPLKEKAIQVFDRPSLLPEPEFFITTPGDWECVDLQMQAMNLSTLFWAKAPPRPRLTATRNRDTVLSSRSHLLWTKSTGK